MSNEIQVAYETGRTVYSLIRDRTGRVWSTSGGTGGFESYSTARYADYPVSLTEQGSASAFYAGTMPAAVPPGVYSVQAKRQAGGSPAETDPAFGGGDIQWNGSAVAPLSDIATSGVLSQMLPARPARGDMIRNFLFKLVSSLDHVTPLTSGVVSGSISRDGGNWGPLQSGLFTEVGFGWYNLQALTSGDLLANTAALRFTANGVSGGQADPRDFSFVLQRSNLSG